MKKFFATSALAMSLVAFSSFTAFATCPGDDCQEIVNPTFDECPAGNCDGGWVNAWAEGNTFGEVNVDSPEQVWAEGCSALEIGVMAGAPASGEASISNVVTQGLDISKMKSDGTGGLRMQDLTTASLNAVATDGGVAGGAVYSENHMNANLWADTWETGMQSGMESQTSMTGMVCETPGTDGSLNSQVMNAAFQTTDNGNGTKTFQNSQTTGVLKVNN